MSFPVITIRDMVRLQKMLVERIGIPRLLSVAGGSMGGMQALSGRYRIHHSCTASARTGD